MLAEVQNLCADAAKLAGASLWPLTDHEVVDSLRAAHRCEQILAVLKLRLVRQAAGRGTPAARGHRTTTGWLRDELLLDPVPARDMAAHATALTSRPTLEEAILAGTIDLRQAMTIAAAVNAIPATLAVAHGFPDDPDASSAPPPTDPAAPSTAAAPPPHPAVPSTGAAGPPLASVVSSPSGLADEAEAALLAKAAQFPAYQLRRLGERILVHVAPEVADRADEAALRRAEARARRKRTLTFSQPRDGLVHLFGTFGIEDAAVLNAALQPLCAPAPGDDRPAGRRRADALIDVCRLALRTGDLPSHGGEPAQVTVTIPFDPLTARLGTGTLGNGERISAPTARRLACDARILPVVLGSGSQVLDAGRSRRLATGPLRQALTARDGGCAFPGCDRPPRWCDAHHLRPWSRGGRTSIDNLVLLCRRHHGTLHDPTSGWTARLGADRLPEFVPPPWTDPSGRPRRNEYHRRT